MNPKELLDSLPDLFAKALTKDRRTWSIVLDGQELKVLRPGSVSNGQTEIARIPRRYMEKGLTAQQWNILTSRIYLTLKGERPCQNHQLPLL